MDLATAVERLEAAGTGQNRKIYRRHGAHDPLFGVSFAVLDRVAKEAKRDHALARIGVRNPALRAAAEAAAGRIGIVTVDHGDTGCVTPAAVPYISRTWGRKAAKAEAIGARA